MIIHIKDVLTLDDDNEYVVASKMQRNNKTYYYLVDKNNYSNRKFCYEDKEDLIEISDKKEITKLLPYFAKAGIEELKK